MIAVNIMNIEVTALLAEDSPARANEVFSAVDVDELPVLNGQAVIIGVLSRQRLLRAGGGKSDLNAGGLSERGFKSAGPEAKLVELRNQLKGVEHGSVFIVDNGGRLLGRVGEAELARRAAEYLEYGK